MACDFCACLCVCVCVCVRACPSRCLLFVQGEEILVACLLACLLDWFSCLLVTPPSPPRRGHWTVPRDPTTTTRIPPVAVVVHCLPRSWYPIRSMTCHCHSSMHYYGWVLLLPRRNARRRRRSSRVARLDTRDNACDAGPMFLGNPCETSVHKECLPRSRHVPTSPNKWHIRVRRRRRPRDSCRRHYYYCHHY